MAYQIEPTKPLGAELARITCELLDQGAIAVPGESLEERIHRSRTTCKKGRAVLRLLRNGHPGFFRRENRRLRDAANCLAEFRDAEAVVAAGQLLQPIGRAEHTELQALRRRLDAHHQAALADEKMVEERLAVFARELHASLTAVKGWQPAERGFAAMAPEIEKTYRRARRLAKRMDHKAPGTEYHDWRKAVKAFGYHCRLLRGAWPEIVKPFSKEVDRLGELLGTEHDLTVLAEFVTKSDGDTRKPTPSERRILKLIDRQRRELRSRAHAVAPRLFAEKPRAYVARLARWWGFAAKTSGGEKPAPSS